MRTQYEIVTVQEAEITVDVPLLAKRDEVFFNATKMAKPFGKLPAGFLRLESTKEYIAEILKEDDPRYAISHNGDLVRVKRGGKYQGTWLHNELAFEFAGWCSALFRRQLHRWAETRIQQEHVWKQKRLEAKTGFLPMTNAVLHAHDPVKHYHFSNEADLINRIVLGMSAKEFRLQQGVESVRDGLDAGQLAELNRLQVINTGLIEVGMDYKERKARLTECHRRGQVQLGLAA